MKKVPGNLTLRFCFLNMLLSLLLTAPLSLSAQFYTGDLTLTSQEAVDAFSYTEVTGFLSIKGYFITNLNGLSSLTSVGGGVRISYADELKTLDGLSSLTLVGGHMFINDNAALASLDGLSSLKSVKGSLQIYNNPVLTNLDDLSSLTSVGKDVHISSNDNLTNRAF